MSALFAQIKSALDQFAASWQTNDAEKLGAGFTEDGTLINPFGERADGRRAVTAMYAQYFKGMLGGTSTRIEVRNVRSIEAQHAFADAIQTIHAPDGSVVLSVHLSAVLRREGGTWLLVDARPFAYATPPV